MKNTKLAVSLLVATVFVFVGLKYFDSQKVEVEKASDTSGAQQDKAPNPSTFVSPNINCDTYYNQKIIIDCSISPDGKWVIGEAPNYGGLRVIDVTTGKVSTLSKSRYDQHRVWFSDSRRVLGFTGSFPSLDCEGDAIRCPRGVSDSREIIIWDVKSKTYSSIEVDTPPLAYDIEWIISDHTALVYAVDMSGTEGDHFLYTLDLDNKTILLTGNYRWKSSE